jgi:hypothetical protein
MALLNVRRSLYSCVRLSHACWRRYEPICCSASSLSAQQIDLNEKTACGTSDLINFEISSKSYSYASYVLFETAITHSAQFLSTPYIK